MSSNPTDEEPGDEMGAVESLDLDPWERQPYESDAQWLAFQTYRDVELPRTLRKAATILSRSVKSMERHSANCHWKTRIAAYDRHIDAKRRVEHRKRNEGIEKRQAEDLGLAARALAEPVRAFLARLRSMRDEHLGDPNYDAFKQFTLDQLHRMAVESIRYMNIVTQSERLVAGLSLDPSGASSGGDLDEARRNVDAMGREELQTFLLGEGGPDYDDGRAAQFTAVGVDPANPV